MNIAEHTHHSLRFTVVSRLNMHVFGLEWSCKHRENMQTPHINASRLTQKQTSEMVTFLLGDIAHIHPVHFHSYTGSRVNHTGSVRSSFLTFHTHSQFGVQDPAQDSFYMQAAEGLRLDWITDPPVHR